VKPVRYDGVAMTQSFTAEPSRRRSQDHSARARRRVLVTGAAGNIGSYFAQHAHRKYELRLMIRGDEEAKSVAKLRDFGQVMIGDLAQLERMKELCEGIDTVVHLAADPSPYATWESVLTANITGTYHTFVAAKSAGCRRVVYASSIHAVSGYPADVQVKTSEPVNPGDLYGVSKCFGEALARYMAEKEGLSAIAIRIGAFQPLEAARREQSIGMLDAWISRRDCNQLIERCIDVENLKFAIVHGLSDNRFKRLDISDTRALLGYEPLDDLTEENPQLKKLRLRKSISAHNVTDAKAKSGIRKEAKPRRRRATR
jgi:NAD(P)-dependent dehydrogenase (short-subunit alcohol dehydrogenase family)